MEFPIKLLGLPNQIISSSNALRRLDMNTNNAKKNDPRQKDKCLSCQQQTVNAAISGNAVDQFKLGEMYYWVRVLLIFVLSFILNNASHLLVSLFILYHYSSFIINYHFVLRVREGCQKIGKKHLFGLKEVPFKDMSLLNFI